MFLVPIETIDGQDFSFVLGQAHEGESKAEFEKRKIIVRVARQKVLFKAKNCLML